MKPRFHLIINYNQQVGWPNDIIYRSLHEQFYNNIFTVITIEFLSRRNE